MIHAMLEIHGDAFACKPPPLSHKYVVSSGDPPSNVGGLSGRIFHNTTYKL